MLKLNSLFRKINNTRNNVPYSEEEFLIHLNYLKQKTLLKSRINKINKINKKKID